MSSEDDPERNNLEDLCHRISKRRRDSDAKVVDSPSKRQQVDSRDGDFIVALGNKMMSVDNKIYTGIS